MAAPAVSNPSESNETTDPDPDQTTNASTDPTPSDHVNDSTSNNADDSNTTNPSPSDQSASTESNPSTNSPTECPPVSTTKKWKICAGVNCENPATKLQCPVCVKLKLSATWFCSQDCFKKNWRSHNISVHRPVEERLKREKGVSEFKMPRFDWTGPLRPSYVTPYRKVPDYIKAPDYAVSGIPHSEMRVKSQKQIPIYSSTDIIGIRRACKLGREVLDIAGHVVAEGVTTEEIDMAVHDACIARKCYPSPLNYHNFPKSCCTSVNEVICHGVPDCRKLEKGDIVNIDITVYADGYHGDLNETFIVGEPKDIEPKYLKLIKSTYDATMAAIGHVKPGVMCRKFGEIIDGLVKKEGLSVTRSYCGHGIGKLFHCSPNIPHYRRNKAIGKLKPNMVFTIEPMINMGSWRDKTWDFDHWTAVTEDGKRSAQFEHTVMVTEEGVDILTARTPNSVPFWWDIDPDAANREEKEEKENGKKSGPQSNAKQNNNKKGGGAKGKGKGSRKGNARGRNKGKNKNSKRGGRR